MHAGGQEESGEEEAAQRQEEDKREGGEGRLVGCFVDHCFCVFTSATEMHAMCGCLYRGQGGLVCGVGMSSTTVPRT